MGSNRIVYQNWIVDLGHDPDLAPEAAGSGLDVISLDDLIRQAGDVARDARPEASARRDEIIRAVREALEKLGEDEREFIERFYFVGQSYRRIAEKSGRAIYKLEAVHKRALKRLRKELRPTVERLFQLRPQACRRCVICRSPYREQIDELIRNKEPTATWRGVMREIYHRYGLKITTPQILIGHQKYH